MCRRHYHERTPEKVAKHIDMPDDLFFKLEPAIARARYIILSGGEATASHNFLERIRRIRQLNPKAYLKINTNGVKLSSREFAEAMVPLFNKIHLSLNGTKSYAEISGGNSFENIKQSLENIKRVRDRQERPCSFSIGFVLMRKNLDDIVEAAVLAKAMGADEIHYKDLWIHDDSLKPESARHNSDLANRMLLEVQKAMGAGIPVACDLFPPPATDEEMEKLVAQFKHFDFPCYKPWHEINVFTNGKVFLCCNGSTYIGNLNEKSITDIWLGKEAELYREGIRAENYYKACAHCKLIAAGNPQSYEKNKKK